MLNEDALSEIQHVEQTCNVTLVDHDVVQAAKSKKEGADGAKLIDVGGDEDNEQDQVIKDILEGNTENELLTKFIKVLNKILA